MSTHPNPALDDALRDALNQTEIDALNTILEAAKNLRDQEQCSDPAFRSMPDLDPLDFALEKVFGYEIGKARA